MGLVLTIPNISRLRLLKTRVFGLLLSAMRSMCGELFGVCVNRLHLLRCVMVVCPLPPLSRAEDRSVERRIAGCGGYALTACGAVAAEMKNRPRYEPGVVCVGAARRT